MLRLKVKYVVDLSGFPVTYLGNLGATTFSWQRLLSAGSDMQLYEGKRSKLTNLIKKKLKLTTEVSKLHPKNLTAGEIYVRTDILLYCSKMAWRGVEIAKELAC